ncbi:MAG: type IV toxin-antitoxin system AbiEi family antitoxin domain-containing protein [Candidatus Micrarchaeota archaeon]
MNADSFLDALERQGVAVFTLKDAARIIGKPKEYAKLFLSRLAKRKKILRIERGKYCQNNVSLLEAASNLAYPAYVSFLSALAFHRLTTQIPVLVEVACARQRKEASFGGTRIEFVKLKKEAIFGFRRYGNAFVAEPEKSVIDGLYAPNHLPLSEAFYAIKHGKLDTNKLCDYADKLGSSIVKRRLGFLLETAGMQASGRPNYVKASRYALLNPMLGSKGKRDKKWMLVVNEVLE